MQGPSVEEMWRRVLLRNKQTTKEEKMPFQKGVELYLYKGGLYTKACEYGTF